MAPLFLQEVLVGPSSHQVGVFGCTLSKTLAPSMSLEIAQKITSDSQLTLQLVDADYVVSVDHLLFAAIHALTAFYRGTQRASNLGMEILRFIAAQRQISQALDLLGISDSTQQIGGIFVNKTAAPLQEVYKEFLQLTQAHDNPAVLLITSTQKEKIIQEAFQISNQELAVITSSDRSEDRYQALQKLVYDRCALLAISR